MLSVVSVALEHLLRSSTRVAVAGLAVAVVLMYPCGAGGSGAWPVTALHEAGHALVVLLVGGRVRAVHLRADSSGLTWHDGVGARGPAILIAAAGYPAPGLAAVAGAGLVAGGAPMVVGGLAALGTLALLLWVRNVFGVFVTLLGGRRSLLLHGLRTARRGSTWRRPPPPGSWPSGGCGPARRPGAYRDSATPGSSPGPPDPSWMLPVRVRGHRRPQPRSLRRGALPPAK